MLRKVKFNNFYSFKENQEISFLASKKKTYDYFDSKFDHQITKIAGFVGSNASGKTNIMRLFSFLSYFTCFSKSDERTSLKTAFKTFFNSKNLSKFSVEFEEKNHLYYYDFSIKNGLIMTEKLMIKESKKNSRKKQVFKRQGDTIVSEKEFFDASSIPLLKNIRPDVSLVAFLKVNYNIEIINDVFEYFRKFCTNINERGEINSDAYKANDFRMYLKEPDLKETAENFIRKFDLGLTGFSLEKVGKEELDISSFRIEGVHKDNRRLPFAYESSGTRQLIFALFDILYALKHDTVVIIDEIEIGFHPEALNKIISYFIEQNKDSRAQLIFSSHSLGFMNKLDMHQINLVDKNENGESLSYRLSQVDKIRTDDNFLAKYLSGSYGAFPEIRV